MKVIIDLIRKKNEHHVFNFETIKALSCLDIHTEYFLDKESSAIEAIKTNQYINKVDVKSSKFYSWVTSTILLLKILFSYRADNVKFILLSATPFQYKICTILSRILKLDINIFMHGELGYISWAQGLGQKLGRYFILSAFSSEANVKFIALSEYIYNHLYRIYDKANFSYIEHPLQLVDGSELGNSNSTDINIGSFGVHSQEKNSALIYTLAKSMVEHQISGINLLTVGVSNGSFEYDQHHCVSHMCRGFLDSSLIPKEEFMAHVKTLDFALFFSGSDQQYDLIPSGVFADCIALELPIISLSNPKMEFFFQKYGNIGILCENVNEMSLAIANLNENPSKILHFQRTIKDIKQSFNQQSYAVNLSRALYEEC